MLAFLLYTNDAYFAKGLDAFYRVINCNSHTIHSGRNGFLEPVRAVCSQGLADRVRDQLPVMDRITVSVYNTVSYG
jgi:hypothetical protein